MTIGLPNGSCLQRGKIAVRANGISTKSASSKVVKASAIKVESKLGKCCLECWANGINGGQTTGQTILLYQIPRTVFSMGGEP